MVFLGWKTVEGAARPSLRQRNTFSLRSSLRPSGVKNTTASQMCRFCISCRPKKKKITIRLVFAFRSATLFIIRRFMPATCRVKCTPSNFICGLTEAVPVQEGIVYHSVTFRGKKFMLIGNVNRCHDQLEEAAIKHDEKMQLSAFLSSSDSS